jgi:hypothetical protein
MFVCALVKRVPVKVLATTELADNCPATPIPPDTMSAPLPVDVLSIVLVMITVPLEVNPVSIPTLVIWFWLGVVIVPAKVPAEIDDAVTCPPTPTPPVILRAPEVVETLG